MAGDPHPAIVGDRSGQVGRYLAPLWRALGGAPEDWPPVAITGRGSLPSVFPVTDFAVAAIGAAGLAVAELVGSRTATMPAVTIDRARASRWFGFSIRPEGWTMPPAWDDIAGDYAASDGWIKLHTNAARHKAAALAVLGVDGGKPEVARAVARWRADDLEAAIVARGGCAAAMRSLAAWADHPQGRAVAAEPLVFRSANGSGPRPAWPLAPERPLKGIRVLDLTRVLAGPVATRFLAGQGAEVLRVDPPDWDEPSLAPDVTLGKRCAWLDLRQAAGRDTFERLLAQADVLVHGYRPGALDALGLGRARRRALNPALVDVSLDAYGWNGPWAGRRGFDSLVQMSGGIADAGMRRLGRDRPTPLPVQALDHATGYMMAAAAARGLRHRLATGEGLDIRLSLARTAFFMIAEVGVSWDTEPIAPETDADFDGVLEATAWGPARRLAPPVAIDGAPMRWDRPAGPLGASEALWSAI